MTDAPSLSEARRIPDLLAELATVLGHWYPDHAFALVGTHRSGDARLDYRMPCPANTSKPDVPPEEGTNADLILTVLGEADAPMTAREIAFKATGSQALGGAFKTALRDLVRAGKVREFPGPPRAFELA